MHWCLVFISIGSYIVIDVVKPMSDRFYFIFFINLFFYFINIVSVVVLGRFEPLYHNTIGSRYISLGEKRYSGNSNWPPNLYQYLNLTIY